MTGKNSDPRKAAVALAAKDLPDGSTMTMHCPACNAGHEQKLYVSRMYKTLLFQCKRASCGWEGIIGKHPILPTNLVTKPKVLKPINTVLKSLTKEDYAKLEDLYGISEQIATMSRFKRGANGRLVMPLYNPEGELWGHVAKSWDRPSTRKALLYQRKDNVKIHFPIINVSMYEKKRPLVVVEDVLSATKLAPIINSCAILGTHMSDEMAVHLASVTNTLILWLDNDAAAKAVAVKKKYTALFDHIDVIVSEKDPKDTSYEDINMYLNEPPQWND